jgi:hypothetical protein
VQRVTEHLRRDSRSRHPGFDIVELAIAMPVLEAVRNFTREEFALKHRYALVLHTDEPHPHVHVVVKAMGGNGAWSTTEYTQGDVARMAE